MLELAKKLAEHMHRGQLDKSGNDYFYSHVYAITSKMQTDGYPDEYLIVALLHDIVEDTDLTADAIGAIFGSQIEESVKAISKHPDENYEDYIRRLIKNKIAKRVKFYDIQNNLSPSRMNKLDEATRDRLKKKYKNALHILDENPEPRADYCHKCGSGTLDGEHIRKDLSPCYEDGYVNS